MMMHNNFGRDAFRVIPRQGGVRVVREICQTFQEIARSVGWAGEPPEVGRTLEGDAHDIIVGAITPVCFL
jgi:hypothetical protein